jgi:hypothetical protein
VQQSSESVAALAAALAKAQARLVNPEKSLAGCIMTGASGETQRTFRFLPSGLEIVRQCLGEPRSAHQVSPRLNKQLAGFEKSARRVGGKG